MYSTAWRFRVVHLLPLMPVLLALASCGEFGAGAGRADTGVYRILVQRPNGRISMGSGFLVGGTTTGGNTVVATNYHVIEASVTDKARIYIATLFEGKPRIISAELLARDPDRDIALLKASKVLKETPFRLADTIPESDADVKASGFPAVADFEMMEKVQYEAAVASNAAGGDDEKVQDAIVSKLAQLLKSDPSLYVATKTDGKISRRAPWKRMSMIQHQATISEGNSGGPLLDACGDVIGINTIKLAKEPGFYFSVPSNELIDLMAVENRNSIIRHGACTYPSLQRFLPYILTGLLSLTVLIGFVFLFRRSAPQSRATLLGRGRQRAAPADLTTTPPSARGRPAAATNAPGSAQTILPGVATRSDAGAPPMGERGGGDRGGGGKAITLVPTSAGRPVTLSMARLGSREGIVVGRDKSADAVIDDPSVSKRHARLTTDGRGKLDVEDLKSSNGTYRGKTKIVRETFAAGEEIRFGKVAYRIDMPGGEAAPPPKQFVEQTIMERERPGSGRNAGTVAGSIAPLGGGAAIVLSGFDENGGTVRLPLRTPASGDAQWTIGRKEGTADLVIAHSTISSAHARIGYSPRDGLTICDLGSSNGTKVDGKTVGPSPVPIDRAKQITLGGCQLDVSRS